MIEVVCYRNPKGNFGDDLNDLLWKHALPDEVYRSDNLTLIGIGSLLNAEYLGKALETRRKVVVVGSGVAYGQLTEPYDNVEFLAVRGPLSASVIGKPQAAITDGAALLAWPKVAKALVKERPSRSDILFMPHHHSFQFSHWETAAERAGIKFVDPRLPPATILDAYAGAKLVIAEAMHAAIVADTLRIPWIPVTTSQRIDKFKWADWTLSLDLPYEPVELPCSSMNDRVTRWADSRDVSPDESPDWREFSAMPDASIRAYYNSRHAPEKSLKADRSVFSRMVRDVAKRTLPALDELAITQAAQALTKLSRQAGFLSREDVFTHKLSKLVDTVDHLRYHA